MASYSISGLQASDPGAEQYLSTFVGTCVELSSHFPDSSYTNGVAAALEEIPRGIKAGDIETMELNEQSHGEGLRSIGSEQRYVIAFAILVVAFCMVIAFGGKTVWLSGLLMGGCLLVSWQAGRASGVIASIFSALLLAVLPSVRANIFLSLSFLFLCSAMCWLVGWFQHRWKLLESERAEMRMMLDHAPIGVALFDTNRKVLRCNTAFRAIYGFQHEEIVGIIPPLPESQRARWEELLERLQAGKSFVSIETVRAQKDGTQFYARISGSPVIDRSGNLIGLVGIIAKVDDGGYSERLEVRNLESLVQSSSDFMCVAHLDRRMFFLNDSGKDLIGLAYDAEIDDLRLEVFFVDEEHARVAEMLDILPKQRAGVTSQALHLKHHLAGSPIAVSCSFFVITDPLTQDDSSLACVATVIGPDSERISESARGEEAFQSSFRNAPVAVAIVNTEGVTLESNTRFQEMLGYEAEELRRMQFSQLVHPEDLLDGSELFLSLIAGRIDRYQLHKRLVARNGDILFTKMTVSLTPDHSVKPNYRISIVKLYLTVRKHQL